MTFFVYPLIQLFMPESIVRFRKTNTRALFQANITGYNYGIDILQGYNITFDDSIPRDEVMSYFSYGSYDYLITKKNLL